jgi:hypothetical protein
VDALQIASDLLFDAPGQQSVAHFVGKTLLSGKTVRLHTTKRQPFVCEFCDGGEVP